MTSSSTMSRKTVCRAVILGLLVCSTSMAEEGKIYKYVDEKGNVVYSQVPPTAGAKDGKIATIPAYKARRGYSPSVSPYDNPATYSQDDLRYQYNEALRQRQQQMKNASEKRLAELKDECMRQRQTDCNDPAVLRYMESTQIPRPYRR